MALLDTHPVIMGVAVNIQQAMPKGATGPVSGGGVNSMPLGGAAAPMLGLGQGGSQVALVHGNSWGPRVYVAGLAPELDQEVLKAYFSYFGHVKDVNIPLDRSTGLRKPFGFVTMSNQDETNAILALPTHQVTEQHSVNVTLAQPRANDGGPP